MLNAASRAFLTIILLAVMAGTAVAFAVGVNFSPHKTVCIPTGIPGYGPLCTTTKPVNVSNMQIKGLNAGSLRHGKLHLTLKNGNSVPVTVKIVLLIKTTSGQIRRITKTITLQPGQVFTFKENLKKLGARGAKLTLTITDTNGDRATITRVVGKFKGASKPGGAQVCTNKLVQGTLVSFCH